LEVLNALIVENDLFLSTTLMSSFKSKDSSHLEYDAICLLMYRNKRFGAPCYALFQFSLNSLMEYGTMWNGTCTYERVCINVWSSLLPSFSG